jgi:hypothetical protein
VPALLQGTSGFLQPGSRPLLHAVGSLPITRVGTTEEAKGGVMKRRLFRFITAALAGGLLTLGLTTEAYAGFLRDGGDPERTSYEVAAEGRQYGDTSSNGDPGRTSFELAGGKREYSGTDGF